MAKKNDKLFGRTDEKARKMPKEIVRRRADLTVLCKHAAFRQWLYETLDDLCAYSLDEGQLTDFGQGIRAAAKRIERRLLVAPEAVEMLTDFAKREFQAEHEGIVTAYKDN